MQTEGFPFKKKGVLRSEGRRGGVSRGGPESSLKRVSPPDKKVDLHNTPDGDGGGGGGRSWVHSSGDPWVPTGTDRTM